MNRPSHPGLVVAAGLLIASLTVTSCDETTGPDDSAFLSFRYEGVRQGTFAVSGGAPVFSVEGVPLFEDWTLAAAGDSLGGVVISGFRVLPTAGPIGRGDLFVLQLDAQRTGEFSCQPRVECHGRLLFGVPDTGGFGVFPADQYFEIVSGQVSVTRLEPDRITGTFFFTARDEGGTGPRTITVEDGSFDLALGEALAALSVVCMGRVAAGEDCG
jgi:hypothetical protein